MTLQLKGQLVVCIKGGRARSCQGWKEMVGAASGDPYEAPSWTPAEKGRRICMGGVLRIHGRD